MAILENKCRYKKSTVDSIKLMAVVENLVTILENYCRNKKTTVDSIKLMTILENLWWQYETNGNNGKLVMTVKNNC